LLGEAGSVEPAFFSALMIRAPENESFPRTMKFGVAKAPLSKAQAKDPVMQTRHSSGFDQFYAFLQTHETLSVLDMSGASQANISFITNAGHRISSDDIIGTMQQCFGEDFYGSQQAASTAQRFLEQTLTFPDDFFDAALVWDAMQFLISPVIDQTVAQLMRVMKPGGMILAFFNANDKITKIPVHNYRIQDQKTLAMITRGPEQRVQYFNNRSIEKLFDKAETVKFFLTRDHLREVLIRK
jgi:hypothetical protein